MTWFLAFALFSLVSTIWALVELRRPYPLLMLPIFVIGLLTAEFAWFFLPLQMIIAALFINGGALDQPVGGFAMTLLLLSWAGMVISIRQSLGAKQLLRDKLEEGLGRGFKAQIPAERKAILRNDIVAGEWMRSFSMRREGVQRISNIAYGDLGERNLLDIYRPRQEREGGFPILFQIHGGGWMVGNKQQQALPLMNHMAQRGWLCVSINYRLSPKDKFPAHIVDIKRALAWVKENIAEYGGNPEFIAVTGGSAGGHLSALTALSANDPAYQPGFEDADTRVQAAIPLYGVFDFLDHSGKNLNEPLRQMLEDQVMPARSTVDRELWEQASPVARISADAPPFFIIHGANDTLTSPEQAEDFAALLRQASEQPVACVLLPGAQHAFDNIHSIRADYAVNHMADFLEWAHASQQPG